MAAWPSGALSKSVCYWQPPGKSMSCEAASDARHDAYSSSVNASFPLASPAVNDAQAAGPEDDAGTRKNDEASEYTELMMFPSPAVQENGPSAPARASV